MLHREEEVHQAGQHTEQDDDGPNRWPELKLICGVDCPQRRDGALDLQQEVRLQVPEQPAARRRADDERRR